MDANSPQIQAYLYKLNEMTNGDSSVQISMYEVGAAMGIEDHEAGQLAEALFMGGQAELKTLSGGIGITSMGMEALGVTAEPTVDGEMLSLGNGVVLSDQGRENLAKILAEIRSGLASGTEYEILETAVMDIKTIEVQMLSPAPKTAVVREVLNSLAQTLPPSDYPEISARLAAMVAP